MKSRQLFHRKFCMRFSGIGICIKVFEHAKIARWNQCNADKTFKYCELMKRWQYLYMRIGWLNMLVKLRFDIHCWERLLRKMQNKNLSGYSLLFCRTLYANCSPNFFRNMTNWLNAYTTFFCATVTTNLYHRYLNFVHSVLFGLCYITSNTDFHSELYRSKPPNLQDVWGKRKNVMSIFPRVCYFAAWGRCEKFIDWHLNS